MMPESRRFLGIESAMDPPGVVQLQPMRIDDEKRQLG
jgi:hypothetical protein